MIKVRKRNVCCLDEVDCPGQGFIAVLSGRVVIVSTTIPISVS
jgi:hypothetical protein